MNDDEQDTARDLAAAAEVHAARRKIDGAIADLAASPLDEAAANRMREVLGSAGLRKARTAFLRLAHPAPASRPRLSVVTDDSRRPEDPDDAEERVTGLGAELAGGVA